MRFSTDAFISYSANYEDVYLNRIFANQSSGFYVDVGAAHPLFENDTKALYDRGWSGINIEPSPEFFEVLAAERSRDLNLRLVVFNETRMLTFYQVIGTGLSTADPEEADRARAKGFEIVESTVEAETLAHILERLYPPSIDLLKVDVEGLELTVLQSNNWLKFRPKVILVEATVPETPTRRPDNVSPYLASVGYRRVFFDGLNDYFLEDKFGLNLDAFDRPVNVFDNFVPVSISRLHEEVASLRTSLTEQDSAMRAAMQQQAADTIATRKHTHLIEALSGDLVRAKAEAKASNARASEFVAQLDVALVRAARIEQQNASLHEQLLTIEERAAQLEQQHTFLQKELEALSVHRDEAHILRQSTSWRITRPLRAIRKPRRTLLTLLGIKKTNSSR